jgi:hypothetical protein
MLVPSRPWGNAGADWNSDESRAGARAPGGPPPPRREGNCPTWFCRAIIVFIGLYLYLHALLYHGIFRFQAAGRIFSWNYFGFVQYFSARMAWFMLRHCPRNAQAASGAAVGAAGVGQSPAVPYRSRSDLQLWGRAVPTPFMAARRTDPDARFSIQYPAFVCSVGLCWNSNCRP